MIRCEVAITVLLLGSLGFGCTQAAPGIQRVMGPVEYRAAFAEAGRIMRQYFSLAEFDPGAGEMKSRPRTVADPRGRILTRTAARQVATLSMRPGGQYVVVRLAIVVQRLGSEADKQMLAAEENYSGVPGRTPAELEAATTAELNMIWSTQRYDYRLERKILDLLARSLRPVRPAQGARSRPTTSAGRRSEPD